jgi:leader peptidase (prepilin peptidase)/N-methyltransferase
MADAWIWPAGLGLLGLILGSFIATLVVRWPRGESALQGRSKCDGCGRTLGPLDLVPVASFVLLRGRCRACGAAIGRAHLAIELLAAAIGALAGWAAPGLDGVGGALFGWLLLALAALDLAEHWLPDALTATLAAIGLASGLLIDPSMAERLIGGVGGFAALWLIGWGYARLRGREGLGGGDPKLFGAIGLWLGWRLLPFVLLGASLLGLAAVLLLRLAGREIGMQDRVPLGAMLAAAAWLAWLAEALSSFETGALML